MSDKPNVLLIFTDQHRLSAVGCYGETPCRTPNIDRLAAEGTRFENTYTTCPVCSPARASIITGLYPHSHGMVCNTNNIGCSLQDLPDRPDLLSRRLEAEGYACGYSGKWHMGGLDEGWPMPYYSVEEPHTLPRNVGFEGQNFPGHGGGGHRYPEYLEYLKERGWEHTVKPWDENTAFSSRRHKGLEETCPLEATVPYFLTENSINLMEDFRKREQPFFMWHNFWGPHGPYFAPTQFLDMYRNVSIPPWPNYEWPSRSTPGPHHYKLHPDHENLPWEHWEIMIRYYYAFASFIDFQIGRMLEFLEESGLAENTIVVFTSDHGETLGSHGGLTDKGFHHFDETHRIPMIVRMPDGTGAGRVRAELASNVDVYPTVLDAAGAADMPEYRIHGRSLLPLVNGGGGEWRDRIVTEFHGLGSYGLCQRTLRYGDYKYGYNCGGTDELYDLAKDPHEMKNVIGDPAYKDVGKDLRARLFDWMVETDDDEQRHFGRARQYMDM
jgi:arylsulfatase A-like enzyme